MKSCKRCQWYYVGTCKKRRDSDGYPIDVEDNDVCQQFTAPHCGSCSSYKDGYCRNRLNDLGNYIHMRADAVCDRFMLDSELSDGYRRSSGSSGSSGCYLTSACVDYYKKSDDCYELTILRKLRDDYLAKIEGGKEIIENYYEIAPKIVKRINESENKDEYYKYIYDKILECIDFYYESNYEKSIDNYKEMVGFLTKELLK